MKIIQPKPNKWLDVLEYINSHENFTRKEISNKISNYRHTEDQYLLILGHVGFLEKPKTATYIRKMKIPNNISSSKMNKLAYDINYAEEKRKLKIIIQRREKLSKLKIL